MTLRPSLRAVVLLATGCAAPASRPAERGPVETIRHVDHAVGGTASVALAGSRCAGRAGTCRCRNVASGDDAEGEAPAAGSKRLEIRMAADGGNAVLDTGFGRFEAAGPQETCFYVDVPAGSQGDVTFTAHAARSDEGVSPRLQLAEYGPKGPWWYDIVAVECGGVQGRCNRQGVDAWAARTANQRQRGRLEPCGSAVVTQLKWDTTGGVADRDGGYYRDLTVRFSMEVKRFATQFAPGSTECVPK
jgi:hypothetical protein